MQGDIQEAIRNPKRAFQYMLELRWRAKLYTHLKEIFLDEEYRWLSERLKPGTTLIDIGAFIGDSAVYFSMQANVKRVVAYEPMPGTYSEGIKVLRERKDGKILYYNKAVGATDQTIKLPSKRQGGIAAASKLSGKNGKTEIQMIVLEEALRGHKKVAIKCDVEGDEYNIFMDKKSGTFDEVYAMIMEIHHSNMGSEKTRRFFSDMKRYGFSSTAIKKGKNVSMYGFLKA